MLGDLSTKGTSNTTGFSVPRSFVGSLLFLLFLMSFIFMPTWKMTGTFQRQYGLLCISLLLGALWSYAAAGELSFLRIKKSAIPNKKTLFIIFFFFVLLYNYKALQSVIPWRGDEAYHIVYTLKALFFLFKIQKPAMLPFAFLSVFFLVLAFRKSTLFIPVGIILLIFIIFSVEQINENQFLAYGNRQLALRYPFLSRWAHTAYSG
ncbi:MAG: hypothetical protein U5L07_02725 [Desulfobacterales bacterium]|nr:hypothetical protein [Desulfobacterales bacterium]